MIALLAAMVAFMVWAIVHTNARIGWHDDERDAEQFIAELHEDGPWLAFADDIVAVAMLDGALEMVGRPDAPAADVNRDRRPPVLWLSVRRGHDRVWYQIDPATETVQLLLVEPEVLAR